MTYLVCSSSSSLCVASLPAARASTATRRPSGLLMVHAALTLAANVWLCGMTMYKLTPKALSLKFSQKLSAYTRVYTVWQQMLTASVT